MYRCIALCSVGKAETVSKCGEKEAENILLAYSIHPTYMDQLNRTLEKGGQLFVKLGFRF